MLHFFTTPASPGPFVRRRPSPTIAAQMGMAASVGVSGILWFDTPLTVTTGPTASLSIANEVTGDPVFAPDGYHLRPGSAAFERGVAAGVPLDLDGDPRSPLPDLGADELLLALDEKFYLPLIFSGQ